MIVAIAVSGLTPVSAETGPMSAESDGARLDSLDLDPTLYASVKLRCEGHVGDDGPAVACSWARRGTDAAVRAWQLWNVQVLPEAGVRNLVAEVGADTSSIRDLNVNAPAKYLYAVVGLNADGEVVARSRVVSVRLGERPHRDIEQLRLECAGELTDSGPVVGCDWSAVEKAPAVEYQLLRVSADHDRRVVATTGVDVTSYRDDSVESGVRYRYWVIGVDAHGDVVAASRSTTAGVPAPDREIDAPRPTDAARDTISAQPTDVTVDQAPPADEMVDRRSPQADDRVTDRPTDRPVDRPVDRRRDH